MSVKIFHHIDADGLMSAYIVNAFETIKNNEKCEFIPSNYGIEIKTDNLNKTDICYFVDFCPDDFEVIKQIASKVDQIFIIDHHSSKVGIVDFIKKEGLENVFAYIEDVVGVSGAFLCHQILFDERKPQKMLSLVSNFDTFSMPNGKKSFYENEIPFMTGFMFYHNDEPIVDEKLKNLFVEFYKSGEEKELYQMTEEFLSNGRIIFKNQMNQWKMQMERSAFEAKIHGHLMICSNICDKGSMQFDSVYDQKKHDGMFGFELRSDGHWSISVYSETPEKLDCGEFCKEFYNGGGHPGAGGGMFYGDIFKEMFKFQSTPTKENTLKEAFDKAEPEIKFEEINNFEMGELVASKQIKNENARSKEQQLKKLLFDDEMRWILLKENGKITAVAAIKEVRKGYLFVNLFMSFKKGSGAKLIKHVLNDLGMKFVYFTSDWSEPESLNDYYRRKEFGLEEKEVQRDYYKVHYFFRNNGLSNSAVNSFIKFNFD